MGGLRPPFKLKIMRYGILYKYNTSPLTEPTTLEEGQIYATSVGEIVKYSGANLFEMVLESPLDLDLEGNIMENLTDIQLELFWTLCKTKMLGI